MPFGNLKPPEELTWYYRGFISYLFANAMHRDLTEGLVDKKLHEPVLDFSGGVYFGIGLAQFKSMGFDRKKS